ncbi:MAG: tetratricopeptide repeat protein [Labilithrix sp.]|nr:tetratricopeptide repeat protein [Labilithrix sp.]MCW5814052.1 tetratricopeptide repeat protein [Labilithrix sp.]
MRFSIPGLFVLALTAACGGESKPPETPPASTGAAQDPPSSAPAPTGALSGPTAPPSGDDVKKGIAALKAGDMPGAKAAFDAAIQKDPKKADAYHYRGVVNDQTGARAEAEKDYKKALELDPALEESAVNLAALQIDAGKFDDAIALMKRAVAKNARSAAIRVNLAMALSGKGEDPAAANKEFEEAIKLDPNNAITIVTYAAHLGRNNKKAEAATQLQKAAGIAASDPGVLASVALEYKNLKDYKQCVLVLDKAIGVKDVAELRIYRGTCKLGSKDLPAATADFKEAVAKEPNNAVAHYSLGNALADAGKLADAIAEWETYLKLSPDGPMAAAAKKKIELAQKKKK